MKRFKADTREMLRAAAALILAALLWSVAK